MRLRILVFLCCTVASWSAISGGGTTEPGFSFSGLISSLPIGPLLTVAVVFGVLFKVFSRWPELERWLVGASLLLLPPVATYVVGWLVYTGSSSPVRDTGIVWAVVALLLAIAWWLLKCRTTILSSPTKHALPTHNVQPEPQSPPNPQVERTQASLPPQPEERPAKPAARTNDAIFLSRIATTTAPTRPAASTTAWCSTLVVSRSSKMSTRSRSAWTSGSTWVMLSAAVTR